MLSWLGGVFDSRPMLWAPPPYLSVISWDLQTGGVVSAIRVGSRHSGGVSIAYSTNGKMVAILRESCGFSFPEDPTISIYDVVSGAYVHDAQPSVTPLYDIWAHGESLWMAIVEPTAVTIREVGFTPGATCVEVRTLPIPETVNRNLNYGQVQFLPASHRLALIRDDRLICEVLVWSLQDPQCLLYHIDIDPGTRMSFSSDGRFFAYTTLTAEAHIWKETPTGYALHAKLPTTNTPYLSPNGESLVTVGESAIQLWDVKRITITPSDPPSKTPHHTKDFLLDFFLDRPLVVFMRQDDNTATVLDLESGLPQLTIQICSEARGLRVIGDTIVVISGEGAIAWKLPEGFCFPDGRIGVEHSVQTINLSIDDGASIGSVIAASMSLDFRYIAILRDHTCGCDLYLHDASSGQLLTRSHFEWEGGPLSFTPDGLNICCFLREGGAMVAKITQDGLQDDPIMTSTTDIEAGSWGCPWGTPSGHQVTDDGWILGADRKRLLMLPPPWQSHANKRVWNGQFLALLHGSLPEPVILELEP